MLIIIIWAKPPDLHYRLKVEIFNAHHYLQAGFVVIGFVQSHLCCKCRRAFSVAGPTVWNSLPDKLRDPSLSIDSFRRQLKTFLFVD